MTPELVASLASNGAALFVLLRYVVPAMDRLADALGRVGERVARIEGRAGIPADDATAPADARSER